MPDWLASLENVVAAQGRNERDQLALLEWIMKVSKYRELSIEDLENPGRFCIIDQKLANTLVRLVDESHHHRLERRIRAKRQDVRTMNPPKLLRGRQILRMILQFFETDSHRDVYHGKSDFYALRLVCGHEQEYLDRFDRILRDLGPNNQPTKI